MYIRYPEFRTDEIIWKPVSLVWTSHWSHWLLLCFLLLDSVSCLLQCTLWNRFFVVAQFLTTKCFLNIFFCQLKIHVVVAKLKHCSQDFWNLKNAVKCNEVCYKRIILLRCFSRTSDQGQKIFFSLLSWDRLWPLVICLPIAKWQFVPKPNIYIFHTCSLTCRIPDIFNSVYGNVRIFRLTSNISNTNRPSDKRLAD